MTCASNAIVWEGSVVNDDVKDPYWSGLGRFAVGSEDGLSAISYPTTLYIIAELTQLLRDQIISKIKKEKASCFLGSQGILSIPIAVAIPEGVFLPLSIASVHALGHVSHLNDGDNGSQQKFHAVLIPVDPSDAPQRLESMLAIVRPSLILTAAMCDCERLLTLCARVEQRIKNEDDALMDQQLYTTREMQVLDVSAMMQHIGAPNLETRQSVYDQLTSSPWLSLVETISHIERRIRPQGISLNSSECPNVISHICFTSGTTGTPKGCVSSLRSLLNYLSAKNQSHGIEHTSRVLLASTLSFDPCLSDILATLSARATLVIARRESLMQNLLRALQTLQVTHCLCTPTLWGTTLLNNEENIRTQKMYKMVPSLQCVALGGERIPAKLVRAWARPRDEVTTPFRFCSTYGVTEACVYQTLGEVVDGHCTRDVGVPFDGMGIRVCMETVQDRLVAVPSTEGITEQGEIVLFGNQLDEFSSYIGRSNISGRKFIKEGDTYFYRTGDRGFVTSENNLFIVGRIVGEEGMVKVNGVRIELSEVEAAVIDQLDTTDVVLDCMAVANNRNADSISTSANDIICFIVLSKMCLREFGLETSPPAYGAVCTSVPLLTLLRQRCQNALKVMPSTFIIIPHVPLSPTGKRDRRKCPQRQDWTTFASLMRGTESDSAPLEEHGPLGKALAGIITDILNLQPVQKAMLTTKATFGMVGGDSLAATRVVRALYALHNNIPDSRFIGGEYGLIEGPFAARHLIMADSLGGYVDWLEGHGVGLSQSSSASKENAFRKQDGQRPEVVARNQDEKLYEALFQAAAQSLSAIGLALLDAGADPAFKSHRGRLGKISSRLERKKVFRSSPLHLACILGNPDLVRGLVAKGALVNSPDASGMFPLHLVAAGEPGSIYDLVDEKRRIECLEILLDAAAPLSMKDGQKQTIIHVAARSGRRDFLLFALQLWNDIYLKVDARKAGSLDWRDSFNRTPVHWAVLNGHTETLAILLKMGCSPDPARIRSAKGSSLTPETPIEICDRLYGSSSKGVQIRNLLTLSNGSS